MTDSNSNKAVVWILVDQRSKANTFAAVADHLNKSDIQVEIVTITEVIGTVARGAIAGGAERLVRGLRVAMRGRNDEDLVGAVQRAKPDILAITDPRYVRALGLLDSLTGLPMLQLGVFSDYDFDPEWTRSGVQGFVVPHESHKERLVSGGVVEERVLVAGPAIQASFTRELDRSAIREEFGFKEEAVVLVRASGIDSNLLDKLVFQLTLADKPGRLVFHHDGDNATASVLRKAANQYGLRAMMFGNVSDPERYFSSADLIIAGPKDAYIPEIVALDTPLLFVGDEAGAPFQVDFLARNDAAIHVGDLLRLGTELDRALEHEALSAAQSAGAELSSTTGSADVAAAIQTAVEKRHEWQADPINTRPSDDLPPEDEGDASGGGAFESIGGGGPMGKEDSSNTTGGEKEHDFSGISRAQAKEQLAGLIMMERDLERKIDDLEKQQQRWRNRLELAREWKEEDLASEAEGVLRGYMSESEGVSAELTDVRKQKAKLKHAAGGGTASAPSDPKSTGSKMEGRFRKMELDSDLDDLKDRIRKELGE